MGRAPCCSRVGLNRGPWTVREDALLTNYIEAHGVGNWRSLPKRAGLLRCGKSCRLRWMNYLKPDIKRGNITPDEDDLIIRLHSLLGNRWSLIAGRLPGRTDNEIKNYWNTHLSKRLLSEGTDPDTHNRLSDAVREVKKRKSRSNRRRSNKKGEEDRPRTARAESVDRERPTIYLPRPTRITSRVRIPWSSFEDGTHESLGFATDGVGGLPWFDFKGAVDNEDDNGMDIFNGDDAKVGQFNSPDFVCQSPLSAGDATLEKLYEEYLQLLNAEEDQAAQLDSFAESLLA